MAEINVVFEIPDWIVDGLNSGDLERIGGTIVDAASKRVRAWLKEGGAIDLDNPTELLGEQLSRLSMQTGILTGLQAANLAIDIAGFAITYHKLRGIERQLDAMRNQLDRIENEVSWSSRKTMLRELSRIAAALRMLDEAKLSNQADRAQRLHESACTELLKCQTFFHQLLQEILEQGLEFDRAEELSAAYRAWLTAATARIQALLQLQETGIANESIAGLTAEHARLGKGLQAIIENPYRQFVSAGGEHGSRVDAVRQLGREAVAVHEILRGNALQLAWMNDAAISISAPETPALTTHPALAIYIPR